MAQGTISSLDDEQSAELKDLLNQIRHAISEGNTDVSGLQAELEDLLYYASTNEEGE